MLVVMATTNLADTRQDNSSFAFDELLPVLVSSLPAIVGTAFFLSGVIVGAIFGPGPAPAADPFGEPTGVQRLTNALVFGLFLMCYFGAAFGPLLLPLAALHAFALTRALGARSKAAIWAWRFVVVGVVAAALFWGWLIRLDIFI
jgi:hypothetical protein